MKKIILSAFIVASALGVKAQSIHLIPKAGINIAKQSISNVNGEKSKVGFMGGLALNIAPGKGGFSIQPELNYVSKGTKFNTPGKDAKFNLNYLELPVLAKYTFADLVYVNAGPSLALQMGGKDKFRALYGSEARKIDFGVQMGAGVAIPAGVGKFLIDGRYNLGLSDLSKGVGTVKNRGVFASIGYAFPL